MSATYCWVPVLPDKAIVVDISLGRALAREFGHIPPPPNHWERGAVLNAASTGFLRGFLSGTTNHAIQRQVQEMLDAIKQFGCIRVMEV